MLPIISLSYEGKFIQYKIEFCFSMYALQEHRYTQIKKKRKFSSFIRNFFTSVQYAKSLLWEAETKAQDFRRRMVHKLLLSASVFISADERMWECLVFCATVHMCDSRTVLLCVPQPQPSLKV